MRKVIVNSIPLIVLCGIGRLEILQKTAGDICRKCPLFCYGHAPLN